MKLSVSILAVLVSAVLATNPPPSDCILCNKNGNNCARGVSGTANTKIPLSSRLADCSTALKVTVTPNPYVSTITQTLSEPVVPTYATYCNGGVSYGSACLCAGVTPPTVTAATPTVYVTATVVPTTCAAVPRFARV